MNSNLKALFIFFCFLTTSIVFAKTPKESSDIIVVPENYKSCVKDSDCELINTLCGCCELTTINKVHVESYLKMEKQCKKTPPPCDCPEPNAITRCIKGLCTLKN